MTAVRNHVWFLHQKLSAKSLELTDLKGKELNSKVKEMQAIGNRMKQYRKHLNMILF